MKDTEQGKWEDRRMAWWVKYLPHEADGLCVARTQIKVEGNQLPASHLPHEYCVTCAHAPPHRVKSFLKMGQMARELKALQMDRGTEGRQTQGRGASDTFKLACQV